MKKIKYLIILIMLFSLTGCLSNDSMDDIKISTSVYPIKYVVDYLYKNHSEIRSIYPTDEEVIDFKVTDVLLEQYSDTDLFIFNGSSNEKNYVKTIHSKNKDLMIIDFTSNNLDYDYSIEELWLNPNNLLTIANNIKKGLGEYIKTKYLVKEINQKYEDLKIELTNLDGKYYSASNLASNKTIIVSDDAFKFLEKYGLEVISLDKDTVTNKEKERALSLLKSGECNYIYIKYGETNEEIQNMVNEANKSTLSLYTMTNLNGIDTSKVNYITLMNQNLDNLKLELYK